MTSNSWEALDFGDIEKYLAAKLSDDDVGAILLCIKAKTTLKTLKLTGCVDIRGRGLESLRDSNILKNVDLSHVGQHESPDIDPEPQLCEELVVPILDSIVGTGALQFVVLPKVWRERRSTILDTFLENYKTLLESQRNKCYECQGVCLENDPVGLGVVVLSGMSGPLSKFYGMQNFICHICKRNGCYDCAVGDGLCYCDNCKKDYCLECVDMEHCHQCDDNYCSGCAVMMECYICNTDFCHSCGPPGLHKQPICSNCNSLK